MKCTSYVSLFKKGIVNYKNKNSKNVIYKTLVQTMYIIKWIQFCKQKIIEEGYHKHDLIVELESMLSS